MRRLIAVMATTAFLALLGVSVSAVPGIASTHAASGRHIAFPDSGIVYLAGVLDLQPTPSGAWTNSNLQLTLPGPGTYALDLNIRSRLSGFSPINAYTVARLLNVNSDTVLPNSQRILNQIINLSPGGIGSGQNTTAPISERITVNGTTAIRMQATRINAVGATNETDIRSDPFGVTSFRYERISP